MSPISFNQIPQNLRTPLVSTEFDNSRASQGPALLAYRALLIGQKTTGTAVANTLYKVTSADQVRTLAGAGSQLHRMAKAFFANNQSTEAWIGVLADNGSGVAATGTLTVTGPATAAGTLVLYVHGVRVTVAVASGDTATSIATNIVAAITANTDLGVTAANTAGVVTVTAKNKGANGNDLDLRLNYQDGDVTPAGVAVAIVAMANGATNPTLGTLIAAMGDTWFHIIAHPYTDATSLGAIEAEMLSRFGPMRAIDGLAITSANGTQSTLGTLGLTRNSQNSVILSQPGKNPLTSPPEFAAAVAGVVAFYGASDPAQGFQTLPVAGVLPPASGDLFTKTERNLNLFDGISTSLAGAGGLVQLERVITTYQTNVAGAQDVSYLDATTMLTLMYYRFSWAVDVKGKFPRHKLMDDGSRIAAGQAIVTPSIMKAEAIAWFREMEARGLVEDFDQFKNDLVVERDATNRNKLNVLLPPNVVNQLLNVDAKIQFRL